MKSERNNPPMYHLVRCPLPCTPTDDIIDTLPISKSITARHMVIDMLRGCDDSHQLNAADMSLSKDILVLQDASRILRQSKNESGRFVSLYVGESGTALRLLTAAVCVCTHTAVIIDGVCRMRQRPLSSLVISLLHLGADIRYEKRRGYAPIVIWPRKLKGGELQVDASESSQFVTALMLIAPFLPGGLSLKFSSPIVSEPYVNLTAEVMRLRGVSCKTIYGQNRVQSIEIPEGSYNEYTGEGFEMDWSSACFWIEYIIIRKWTRSLFLQGLSADSRQADRRMVDLCKPLGLVLTPDRASRGCYIKYVKPPKNLDKLVEDLSNSPDLVPALTLTCLLSGIPFRFDGIAHLRHKESDRLEALRLGALALGFTLQVGKDSLEWVGGEKMKEGRNPPIIQTFGDHRIAMAFSMAAVVSQKGIVLDSIDVAAKSYPMFFSDLTARLGFQLSLVPSQTD